MEENKVPMPAEGFEERRQEPLSYGGVRIIEEKPFEASRTEAAFSLLSYFAAYCYILFLWDSLDAGMSRAVWTARFALLAVAAFIIAAGFMLGRRSPQAAPAGDSKAAARPENCVWLGCFICCLIGFYLHFAPNVLEFRGPFNDYREIYNWVDGVWDQSQVLLFIHIFAVWWVLAQSGALLEGRSGHLLPMDALNGFIALPFGNIILRVRTWVWSIRELLQKRGKKHGFSMRSAAAAVISIALLLGAVSLLGSADANFGDMVSNLTDLLRFDIDEGFVIRLILSIPVGAWLYGLIAGAHRKERSGLDAQRDSLMHTLSSLRGVPNALWAAVIGVFSAVYLAFYVLQASYLFGAFAGRLPEGFIYSQYAREGFFELCRVMGINFCLLWLVTRMSKSEESGGKTLRVLSLVILAESMLFAVIALSKLVLYISVYGFTPLRLQSSWLVCVLLAGCVLWAYNILTGRPAFRKWMYFGAVTLSLLTLY